MGEPGMRTELQTLGTAELHSRTKCTDTVDTNDLTDCQLRAQHPSSLPDFLPFHVHALLLNP